MATALFIGQYQSKYNRLTMELCYNFLDFLKGVTLFLFPKLKAFRAFYASAEIQGRVVGCPTRWAAMAKVKRRQVERSRLRQVCFR